MVVECEINDVDLENDNGYQVAGVTATCSRCGHTTESFGTGDASKKRCLALLNEECPERRSNFYVDASSN